MARPHSPSVCIIVTAYNYGHFLASCLDSVRNQSVAPDEFVVVNDGSEDATAQILAREDDLEVITQPNLGQAAAFNAGFAKTTADIVIFLDADDRLKPDAVELLCKMWSDDISVLSFDLEMIDRDGWPVGRYDMTMPEVDLLPRLIQDISMPFMPTSGNAFARKAIAFAFPMPEPRWKISADAVLIRAAVLAAPARHSLHTLGEYRVHRHNNWFQEYAAKDWRMQRGHLDIAQAGLELVDYSERAAAPAMNDAVRLSLLFATLKAGVKASELGEGAGTLRVFLSGALRRWSPSRGVRPFLALLFLWVALSFSSRMRSWLIDRPKRPEFVERLVMLFTGDLRQSACEALTPRAPFNRQIAYGQPTNKPLDPVFLDAGWNRHWTSEHFVLCRDKAEIAFTRPTADAAELVLTLEPVGNETVTVRVRQDGTALTRFDLSAHGTVPIQLRATDPTAPAEDLIELQVTRNTKGWARLFDWMRPCQRLVVHGVGLAEPDHIPAGAVLPIGRTVPLETLETSLFWPNAPGKSSGEVLVVAAPELRTPYALILQFGEAQPPGWLSLTANGVDVFSGFIRAGQQITADFSEVETSFGDRVAIETVFRAEEFAEAEALIISDLGWTADPLVTASGLRLLTPGQWIGPEFPPAFQKLFGRGWERSEEGTPLMYDSSAFLRFSPGPVDLASTLHLKVDVGPLGDATAENAPVLVLSMNGKKKAASRLGGRHVYSLTFTGRDVGEDGICEIGFHAGEPTKDGEFLPHGGVALYGLSLSIEGRSQSLKPVRAEPIARHLQLADLSEAQPVEIGMRAELIQEVDGLATRALGEFLDPPTLEALVDLGARAPVLAASDMPDPNERGWLRWLAKAMMNGPPCVTAPELRLSDIPPVDPSYSRSIGRWFGAPVLFATPDVLRKHADWQERMLGEIRGALATADPSGSHYQIAFAALEAFDLGPETPSETLGQAFVNAIETYCLRSGVNFLQPSGATGGGQAILIGSDADLNEGAQTRLMADAISEHGPLKILVPDGVLPDDPRAIRLEGQTVDAAARHILGLGLDVLVIAAPLRRFDLVTKLAARRLAHRQIALGPAPAFSSLDDVARGAWFQEEGAMPGLGFFPSQGVGETEAILDRARLGVDKGALHLRVSLASTCPQPATIVAGLVEALPTARMSVQSEVPIAPAESSRVTLLSSATRTGSIAADLVLIVAGTSEAAMAGLLEAGVPGVVCVTNPDDHEALRRSLAEMGLSDAFVATIEDAVPQFSALATNKKAQDTAVRAMNAALKLVEDQNASLTAWLGTLVPPNPAPPRYLFHHMVKTGGTSLRHAFHEWFDVTEDYRVPWTMEVGDPVDLAAFPPGQMLVGHFASEGLPLSERYPGLFADKGWRPISFVRDPYELALSWYNFEKQSRPEHDPDFKPLPIDAFFENYKSRYLTHFECDESNWKEAVDRYWFIGTLERLEPCIDHLAEVLGKPRLPIARRNVTQAKEQPSAAAVATFAENMAVEFEIYRYIDAKLTKRLSVPWTDDRGAG